MTLSPCDCNGGILTGGFLPTNVNCYDFAHSIPTGNPQGTLISFYFDITYCSITPFNLLIDLKPTSGSTSGSLAYEITHESAVSTNSINSVQSFEYEFGWDSFDVTKQTNQLCFRPNQAMCVQSFSYHPKYIIKQAYSTYSSLTCIAINPTIVGLQWFVFDY